MTQNPAIAPPPALPVLSASGAGGGEQDLRRLSDLPVRVTAIVGRARIGIGSLLAAGPGTVIELDRKVGEPVDILVNDRLVARGDIVMIDGQLGVTLTELLSAEE